MYFTMLTVLTTTQLFSVMEDDRGSSVTSNLFSDQVIKNAAWRSRLINDTWQPERKRSVQTFIHLWTYTVHLSVRPHTHTSSYSSSIFPSSYLHPLLTLGYVCVCVCVCVWCVCVCVCVCVSCLQMTHVLQRLTCLCRCVCCLSPEVEATPVRTVWTPEAPLTYMHTHTLD